MYDTVSHPDLKRERLWFENKRFNISTSVIILYILGATQCECQCLLNMPLATS